MTMSDPRERFYITTAIDYPNSLPHVGHAYEKTVADFYARCARLRGRETWFLIGLDEHGQKIQEAAEREGKSPQAFVDEKAEIFRQLYDFLEISCDDFIRTSEPRHQRFAAALYSKVRERGDIYKGLYRGEYCISCEKALTRSELVDGKCPIHLRPTTPIEEESYFFRLGKYRDAIRGHIERHPEFIRPAERRNEVLSRLSEEVLDLSVSRSTFRWGVPVPDDPAHVLYVWFDALSNYLSALLEPRPLAERFWPADCHVIGKDILWFHTVIWPAMLLSAGWELPRQVYVHGFILDKDGRKMAKHLGNVVDPLQVATEYSVDVLRFYFLRTFSSGQDGKFSLEELEERYQSELGNDLGNLVMRVAKLVATRAGGELSFPGGALDLDAAPVIAEYLQHAESREHHRAVEVLWNFIRRTNAYLNERAPWKITDERRLSQVLYSSLEALRAILHLLAPIMPRTAEQAAASLGFSIGPLDGLTPASMTYRVRAEQPLFPRREKATVPEAPPEPAGKTALETKPAAAADPFARLEIRIGRIEEVREHPNADSLFAMVVDIGGEKRSICAGLRGHVKLEDLRGRKVVVLANLKPAQLRGIESKGMVLATDTKGGKVVPVDPGEAEPGELVTVEGIAPEPKAKLSKSDFEKAPLVMAGGRVTYRGKPLRTSRGELTCEAENGAPVR
jgi:methionyl-tRNA synthetase